MMNKISIAILFIAICFSLPLQGEAAENKSFVAASVVYPVQESETEQQAPEFTAEVIQIAHSEDEKGKIAFQLEVSEGVQGDAVLVYSNIQTGDCIEVICTNHEASNQLTGNYILGASQQGEYRLEKIEFSYGGATVAYKGEPEGEFERPWPAGIDTTLHVSFEKEAELPELKKVWIEAEGETAGIIFAEFMEGDTNNFHVTVEICVVGKNAPTQKVELTKEIYLRNGNEKKPSSNVVVGEFTAEKSYAVNEYFISTVVVGNGEKDQLVFLGEELLPFLETGKEDEANQEDGENSNQAVGNLDGADNFWQGMESALRQGEAGQVFLYNAEARGAVPQSILEIVQEKEVVLQLLYGVNTYTFTKETIANMPQQQEYLFSELQGFVTYEGVEGLENPETGVFYKKSKK